MTTVPNLPTLPKFILDMSKGVGEYTFRHAIQKYALAAYQAGRNAGLEEAGQIVLESIGYGSQIARDIRHLKSDAKGGI